ncbi:MAG: aminoacyl-tRNA hydrolase [Candidatus Limnocylindrales bacterium]
MKKIVVGLGNPGARYERSRHNIGWMVLDRLADRTGASGRARAKDAAATVRGRLDDDELILVKPMTFMNASGEAVRKVLARERTPLPDVLVVVDDMALPFGRLRMKARGSAGGHNGLRSIIGEMGTESFARLRVGIGAPQGAAVAHVLGDFEHAEQRHLDLILDAAADAVEVWARQGPDAAANRWNGWQPELSSETAPAGVNAVGKTGPPSVASDPPSVPSDPSSAPSDPSSAPSDPSSAPPAPDAQGVVRSKTGWRKLLPDILTGRARDETR